MLGSISCALSDWPLLSCWLSDHAWLLGLLVPISPMLVIVAAWWWDSHATR